MTEERINRTPSIDGTEIAGRVHGEGPPLVLVHGALGDGDTVWTSLLPFLTGRFSCHAMSTRGRGLSAPSDDVSLDHAAADVVTYVESLGEPAALVGLSSGALLSLAAAERTSAVASVVAYEPPVFEVIDDPTRAVFMDTIDRFGATAAQGDFVRAAQDFIAMVTNDEEFAMASELELARHLAPNVPVQAAEFSAFLSSDGSSPTDPAELGKISIPVLLLQGTRSVPDPWFQNSTRHVAGHVSGARVEVIDGAGHLGPIFAPDEVARRVIEFVAPAN